MTDLPPSAKFVRYVLDREGPLRYNEIVNETGLPESTVKWALRQLKQTDSVVADPDSADLRADAYNIHPNADV